MTWCTDCVSWFAKQRAEKPSFSRQGHLDRCVCCCHPHNREWHLKNGVPNCVCRAEASS